MNSSPIIPPQPASEPRLLVLVGFGDLGKKYVLPALLRRVFNLNHRNDKILVVDVSEPEPSWEDQIDEILRRDDSNLNRCADEIRQLLAQSFIKVTTRDINSAIHRIEQSGIPPRSRFIYLATPDPRSNLKLVSEYAQSIIRKGTESGRIYIEKPYTLTNKEARELRDFVTKENLDDNVFLVDHYLFDERVQWLIEATSDI